MANEVHFRKLENMMYQAPFIQWTGTRVEIAEGVATISLPVREDFFHAAGAMHGALYFMALDNAAYFAASSLVEDAFLLTTSFTTYLTRPVSKGVVRAEGKVVNQNRSQIIAEAVMFDERDREIARANGIFVRGKMLLTPEIGYQ